MIEKLVFGSGLFVLGRSIVFIMRGVRGDGVGGCVGEVVCMCVARKTDLQQRVCVCVVNALRNYYY